MPQRMRRVPAACCFHLCGEREEIVNFRGSERLDGEEMFHGEWF